MLDTQSRCRIVEVDRVGVVYSDAPGRRVDALVFDINEAGEETCLAGTGALVWNAWEHVLSSSDRMFRWKEFELDNVSEVDFHVVGAECVPVASSYSDGSCGCSGDQGRAPNRRGGEAATLARCKRDRHE